MSVPFAVSSNVNNGYVDIAAVMVRRWHYIWLPLASGCPENRFLDVDGRKQK